MQSYKGDTSGKLEEMERNLHEGAPWAQIYTCYRGISSILGIGPRHTSPPDQAFCTFVGATVIECAMPREQ
jgi:hypothetical protein